MNKRGNKRADGFKVISSILNKIGLFSSIRRLSPSVSSIHQLRSSLNIANTLSPYTHITSSQTLTPISVTAKQTRFLIKSIPSLLILVLGLLIFSGTALAAQYGSPFEVFGAFEWDDKNYENYWNSIYNNSLFYNNSENIGIRVMTPSEVLTVNGNMSVNDSFYVLDSGNVGIGTSTPSSTLNVVGDLNVTGTSYLGQITINTQNITTAGILARAGDKNNLTIYNATGSAIAKFKGDGGLEIWSPAGAANDYVSLFHDGTNGRMNTQSGAWYMQFAGNPKFTWDSTGQFYPSTTNAEKLGISAAEWLSLYLGENASSGAYFGLAQEAQISHNSSDLNISNTGGEVNVVTKALKVWDDANGAADSVSVYHDATNGYISSASGNLNLDSANAIVLRDSVIYDTANARDLGGTTSETRGLYLGEDALSGAYFGLDQDWRLNYDESNNDRLYLNGTGTFEVVNATSGQSILLVNATNRKIGIGTNTPQQILDVAGTFVVGNTDDGVMIWRTGTIGELVGIDTDLGGYNELRIRSQTGNQLTIETDGDFGVGGQTNPEVALHVGMGSSSHSLTNHQNDTYITGNFEVDGTVYFDTTSYYYGSLIVGDNAGFNLGTSSDTTIDWSTAQATENTAVWGLGTTANSLLFVSYANVNKDHDHPAQSNPTIFVHSALDPTSDNTKWASVSHDNVSMVLDSGSDRIVLDDNTTVSGDLVLGDNDVGNVLVDMYDNSTEFVIDVVHNVTFITAEVVSMEKAFKLVPQAAGTWPVGCNANSAGAMFVNATGNNLCFCDGSNWLFVSNNSGC